VAAREWYSKPNPQITSNAAAAKQLQPFDYLLRRSRTRSTLGAQHFNTRKSWRRREMLETAGFPVLPLELPRPPLCSASCNSRRTRYWHRAGNLKLLYLLAGWAKTLLPAAGCRRSSTVGGRCLYFYPRCRRESRGVRELQTWAQRTAPTGQPRG